VRILLDTHAFIWWITGDRRLSDRARGAIGAAEHEVFVSAVSAWEIVTKARLGRLRITERVDRFVPEQLEANAFQALPLTMRHALGLAALPDLHRDPFDRMLVAQALAEQMPLVTGDRAVAAYPVDTIW
jgi:PIN domain nuclease of toxin-antitoxin system